MFWNLFAIVFLLIITYIPTLKAFFNNEFNIQYLLNYLWIGTYTPQFWFIRALIFVVIISPIISLYLKYFKIYGVIILGLLWYFNFLFSAFPIDNSVLSIAALFFFPLGAYFGINKSNLIEIFGKFNILSFILYPIVAFANLFTKQYFYNIYIHNAGIIFVFNLTAYLLKNNKVKTNKFLSASSFFVFAIHQPFLMISLKKISYKIINTQTDFVYTILYFLNVIIVVIIALGLYSVLKKITPKFTGIITGGR